MTEFVTIRIPRMYAEKLAKWASVGRTLDAAMAELSDYNTEQANFTIDELEELKQPLDAVGCACTQWKIGQELLHQLEKSSPLYQVVKGLEVDDKATSICTSDNDGLPLQPSAQCITGVSTDDLR